MYGDIASEFHRSGLIGAHTVYHGKERIDNEMQAGKKCVYKRHCLFSIVEVSMNITIWHNKQCRLWTHFLPTYVSNLIVI